MTGARPSRDLGGLLLVMAAAASMGTLGPVAGLAYREGVAPAMFSAMRAGIGATILVLLLLSGRAASVRLGALPVRQRRVLLVAIAVNGAMNLCLFLAFGRMAVGLVMAVFYLNPVLVAVMAAVLGRERLTPLRVASLAIAVAGLALVLGSRLEPGAGIDGTGLALAFLAAIGHAAYLVAIRGGFDDVPGVQATSLVLAGGLLVSGTAALVLEAPGAGWAEWATSPGAWLAILAAATFGALPKAWIIGGVRRIGSTRASVALLTEPVVAVVVAALVLGQALGPAQLAGGALLLVAVVIVQQPPGPADSA